MQFDWQATAPLILDWAARVGGALLFVLTSWVAANWARRVVRRGLVHADFDPTLTIFLASLTRWGVLAMALLACLGIFGIETTSVAAVMGAAGLAVGLAFQGTLSNVAAGTMLLVFRPFKVGDFVNAGGVTGTVSEIQLFTTVFDTPDNRRIVVPNTLIFGQTIENVTFHDTRRVNVDVGTEYAADLDRTREVLQRCIDAVPGVLPAPTPQVFLKQLGASSIDWQVRVWCATADYWKVHEAVVRAIKKALDDAAIGIPFPQLDVHLHGAVRD